MSWRLATSSSLRTKGAPDSRPPGTPLPFANAAQIKASYLGLLLAQITAQHLSNANLAKSITGLASRFTDAERQTIFANITARLNAGETVAAIITDTAA